MGGRSDIRMVQRYAHLSSEHLNVYADSLCQLKTVATFSATANAENKKAATKYEVQLDFVGFEIPDAFVLGYGLDYAQLGRNLSQIYVIDKDE